MHHLIDDEFKKICATIIQESLSPEQWAEIESDDMFNAESYQGGYDADEVAFCFSYWNRQGKEYWFQVTLNEVHDIVAGRCESLEIRPAG